MEINRYVKGIVEIGAAACCTSRVKSINEDPNASEFQKIMAKILFVGDVALTLCAVYNFVDGKSHTE